MNITLKGERTIRIILGHESTLRTIHDRILHHSKQTNLFYKSNTSRVYRTANLEELFGGSRASCTKSDTFPQVMSLVRSRVELWVML